MYTHCLKITQNVAFEFLAFSTNFCPINIELSGNTYWVQFLALAIFGIINELLSSQNVNVARYACNVE